MEEFQVYQLKLIAWHFISRNVMIALYVSLSWFYESIRQKRFHYMPSSDLSFVLKEVGVK